MSFDELFPRPPDDDADAAEDEEDSVLPAWFGPRQDELGIAMPQALVVARSDRGVVALSHVVAHSTGAAFVFVAEVRDVKQSRIHAVFHAQQHGFEAHDGPPDEFLRIGLELADGVRVSNLAGRFPWRDLDDDEPPPGPVFHGHLGGGGMSGGSRGVTMQPRYWLWPLPPPGPLRIWCEWPMAGIALANVEIDGAAIRAASTRALPLWEGS
jgi:hypothetical protein